MHAVTVADSSGYRHHLVLRRFVRSDWLAREPDLAHREARILRLLEDVEIPTPELIAVDGDGEASDVPAVLMKRLPGRVDLKPRDMNQWLHQLASVLPAIHAVDTRLLSQVSPYRPYKNLRELEPPSWSSCTAAWEKALSLLGGPSPRAKPCFIHRDYHPTNVLWSRGRLTGIVDWVNASHGPAIVDIGHCRLNLAALYGVEVADRFLVACRALMPDVEYHPYWDVLTAIEWLPEPGVFPGWQRAVEQRLTIDIVRSRLDDYVSSVVARL